VLVVELLEGVVREHDGAGALGDAEHERVAAPDGAGGRRHQLAVQLGRLELGALGRLDPVAERGVHHDHHLSRGVLRHIRPDRLVQLAEAGRGPALGREVRAVDDDVVGGRHRPSVNHPGGPRWPVGAAQPIARSRRSACSSWCWAALPVAGLADSGRLTCTSR
jgi:hypothetical protein